MATYQKCDADVSGIAGEIMKQFESHEALLRNKVRIDFLFAYGKRDPATGDLISDALTKNGVKALAVTRKIGLKDRAAGRGDAEIVLDADWWEDASEDEQRAVLDHELTHLVPTEDLDDLDRPKLALRHHDVEVGWFRIVAERHGAASQECQQAKRVMDSAGQYFWPSIAGEVAAATKRFGHLEVKMNVKE